MSKWMSAKEFQESGLLQEVNRLFFHPRGLALGVLTEDIGEWQMGGIRDCRDDPEGMVFADLTSDDARDKAACVAHMARKHSGPRLRLFGGAISRHEPGAAVVQPIGTTISEEADDD